jgi:prepilin-type N-terminal cleavage/methylation domain-containing protein
MKRDDGFTLLEVLIAMLIGTIGLLGTVAVQQAIINSSKNANDAAVAMRLATQKVEQLNSRSTDTEDQDKAYGLHRIATAPPPAETIWLPVDASNESVPEYVDAEGNTLHDDSGYPKAKANITGPEQARYRWQRQWRVINTGRYLPYVISVVVTYDNDVGTPKSTRIDMERRKAW